jgi:hypothetical protein
MPTIRTGKSMLFMIGVLGFNSHWELGIFLFTMASGMALKPTQPPVYGYWVLFSLG